MQHYQRIRDLREDSDLTQEALCKKLYMHKTTYTNYEQGKHTVPLDFAVQLADFYQVSIDISPEEPTFRRECQLLRKKPTARNTSPTSPNATRAE